ncbi:MAG: acyl-CoA thioesterase [Acidimicrobiia bacterium]
MTWQDFFGMGPGERPERWRLPVTDAVTGGVGQLFGGVAFGAAVAVLEELTGKPAAWATAQFLSNAFPPEQLELDATVVVHGHNFSQARVVGHVGDREVVSVLAALGAKRFDGNGMWRVMPLVAPPDQCARRAAFGPDPGGLHTRIEQRIVEGEWGNEAFSPAGVCRVWMRMADGFAATPAGLAVVADFLPLGIRSALGRELFGSSLDNTVRYVQPPPPDHDGWVLADLQVDAVQHGVGHGTVHLWSGDGTLLAVASQTCSMRELRPGER